jgi:hypothetical protein
VLLRSAWGGLLAQHDGNRAGPVGEVKKISFCSDPSSEAAVLSPQIYHFVITMTSHLARFFPLIVEICRQVSKDWILFLVKQSIKTIV